MREVRVVLISTYELGRQPFGLASPAAWLQATGAAVTCCDLAVAPLDGRAIASADLVAFHVPMHTATRLAIAAVDQVRQLNPRAHLCFYGLYAPMNEAYLRSLGARTILGGEFEAGLASLVRRLAAGGDAASPGAQAEPVVSLARQDFLVPDRTGLPDLRRYARLDMGTGEERTAGYTEATRGCKHRCRHCPIVPVYGGRFRVVPRDVVLEDVRRQVEAGARHITFGDPDFFNGPGHALPLVAALHARWPHVTYDATIKIEHLLRHRRHLATLRDTGCLFVTSAVESIDARILEIFDKRHTREDFLEVVALFRDLGLALNPTFVTFTPWTTLRGYRELLALLAELDLVDHVAPIQYAIRLLVPAGSRLLDVPGVREALGAFDAALLCYPWSHPDPRVDRLYDGVLRAVKEGQRRHESRHETFARIWEVASAADAAAAAPLPRDAWAHDRALRAPIPRMTEPWFC